MVQSSECVLDIGVLMSDPFLLFYGDSIEAKIIARNAVGESPPAEGRSTNVLTPYISGQIEFGSNYYEFDEEEGVYPTEAELSQLNIEEDISLTRIIILETEGYQGLQGI